MHRKCNWQWILSCLSTSWNDQILLWIVKLSAGIRLYWSAFAGTWTANCWKSSQIAPSMTHPIRAMMRTCAMWTPVNYCWNMSADPFKGIIPVKEWTLLDGAPFPTWKRSSSTVCFKDFFFFFLNWHSPFESVQIRRETRHWPMNRMLWWKMSQWSWLVVCRIWANHPWRSFGGLATDTSFPRLAIPSGTWPKSRWAIRLITPAPRSMKLERERRLP